MMMKARRSFVYNGSNLDAGEIFELVEHTMTENIAVRRVLTAAGLAESYDGEAKPQPKPKSYRGGRYNRRDLRAMR